MKKGLVAVTSALLTLAMGLSGAANVSAAAPCEFSLSSVAVPARAKSISVPLSMKSESAVCAADFVIDLPEGITLLSCAKKSPDITVTEMENGDLSCSVRSGAKPLSGDVALCNLVLALPEKMEDGQRYEIALTVSPDSVLDSAQNSVESAGGSSAISVEGLVMYGDANGDCVVNAKDIIAIMRRLLVPDTDIDLMAADVNLDSRLNTKDIIQIMKHMLGVQTVRLGHKDVTETLVEANCQHKGQLRMTCILCGDSKTVETPIGPHKYAAGKCTVCGLKHRDYPILAYTDYLKKKGSLESSLRGYALYETIKLADYSLLSSNICDSKNSNLVIFGVGTFQNSLSCSVSIEMSSISKSYKFTYYANQGDKQLAKAEGTVSADLGVSFTAFSGSNDSKVKNSHLLIAKSIIKNCISHTDKLMKASGLGVSAADLGFVLK